MHSEMNQLHLLSLIEEFDRFGGYVIDQTAYQPTDQAILGLAKHGLIECHRRPACGTSSHRTYRLRVRLTDKGRWHLHTQVRQGGLVTH